MYSLSWYFDYSVVVLLYLTVYVNWITGTYKFINIYLLYDVQNESPKTHEDHSTMYCFDHKIP